MKSTLLTAIAFCALTSTAFATDDVGIVRNTHVGLDQPTSGARCVAFDLVHTDGTPSTRYAVLVFTPADTVVSQSIFANEGRTMSLTPGLPTICGNGFPSFSNLNGPY